MRQPEGHIDMWENCDSCKEFRYCLDMETIGKNQNEMKLNARFVCGLCYFQFKKENPDSFDVEMIEQ